MGNLQSTSSSNNTNIKYDVFLSFRGEDTRDVFTSHLYAALRGKQIETFMDDRLIRGDDISSSLSRAIEESKISVVIFSKDYASSKWCLRELVKIMKHVNENNQIVIPVFYDVDPSDVRKQTGSFKDSFDKYGTESPEEVQTWREALTNASNKSGRHSSAERNEATLVLEIVKDIWEKLKSQYMSPGFGGLIGLERINQIISLLSLHDRTNVLIIGILGMGGIGKTTLADAIFNNNSNHFQGVCFIQNVREKLQNSGGLAALQKEILSKVLKDKKLELGSPTIPPIIKERLNRTRVFIVLDDVDDFLKMENLVKGVDGLGKGSRILITSRDRHVFRNCRVNNDNIYEVKGFNPHEALQLFCSYAFKDSHPTEDFTVLLEEFVNYAKGNPLALKVLGSSLYQKSKQEWESAVNTLRTNLDPKIFDVLKINFDGLNNREKNIFLDIACFLKGEGRQYVAEILDNCDYSLSVLIDKSLITISWDNSIQMHDLLQEMGREIVHNESPDELGKRSRLWRQEEVLDTLKCDDGTKAIQGIVLDMSKIKDIRLSPQVFKKMYKLRLLKFSDPTWILEKFTDYPDPRSLYHSKVHFGEGLSDLSDKLRSLIWLGYPLPALPSHFNPDNLVELDLSHSNVERLWEDTKHAPKLKWLVLSYCTRLTKIPDLSESPLIEKIDIRYCSSLLDFPPLAQHVNNLRDLFMQGCESLWSFSIDNITKFLEISGSLIHLNLSWTAIDEVPPSIECLTKLHKLNLSHCTRLQHIPPSIWKLKSLYKLNLKNCSRLESFPDISLDTVECLKKLKLSGTAIKALPENLGDLKSLKSLYADRTAISQLPSSMKHLKNLRKLSCRGCRGLRFTRSSGLPCSLTSLCLSDCNLKEIPEDICRLSSLISLDLSENHFEHLPKGMQQLCDLVYLILNNCKMLQSLTELPSSLEYLSACDCEQLRSIPDASEFAEIIRNTYNLENICIGYIMGYEFIFTNCRKLEAAVGNMLALLIKYHIKVMTNGSLSLSLSLKIIMIFMLQESDSCDFCYSGSEVPGWFIYRTEGSSIEFGVHEWHQLLGFAVCAVIAFEKYCYDGDSEDQLGFRYYIGDRLSVRYKFIINNKYCKRGEISVVGNVGNVGKNKTSIDSDHVTLQYLPRSLFRELPSEFTNCSIEFSLSQESPNCSVKYCGVCPIYGDQNIGETSGKRIGESSGRRGRTSNEHQEEEVEPHSKRLNLDLSCSL